MQNVYSECTCCYKALTPEEMQLNKQKENYYYSICTECLNKYTDRLIEIVTEY